MKMKGLLRKILVMGIAALFLGAVGSVFFKVNMLAHASGTIYIRANGLVEGTDKITNENNVTYTFTDDINDSIVVERSNVMIDADGYTLNGSWSLMYGFNLTSVSNVTIKNVNIVRFGYATWLEGASQCVISDNTCVDDEGCIWLVSSVGCTVSSNNIVRSVEGVALDSSSGNIITGNNITDCYYGVYVRENSVGNTISGNYIKGTGNGAGVYLNESPDNVISGNDIRDSPNEHICLLYSSNNNTISGNTLTNSTADVGVYVYQCSLNSFFGNNITGNADSGIRLDSSADSTISENSISENLNGVYLWYSSNITVSGNDITANNASGIILDSSGNNIISENNITANNEWGINPAYSNNNTISGNNIRSNNCGINSASSNFNIVSANNIIGNGCGMYLESSSNNTVYHNNLVNNTNQAVVDEPGYTNNWDDGYPSGGNYWSDYTDVDNNSGPYQNITGTPDGIWDDPYIINENNTDRYPFANLYDDTPPTIGIPSRTPSGDILPNQEVTVVVNVTDNLTGVKNVTLYYTIDDGLHWNSTEMLKNPSTELYEANIPSQEYGKIVRFKIEAFDYAGNNQTRDGVETYCIYQIVPEFLSPTILLAFTMAILLLAIVFRKKRKLPTRNKTNHNFPFSAL